MIGHAICWGLALGMLFSRTEGLTGDYTKLLFAMGFILLGIFSKAVSVYHDTHTVEIEVEEDENGNLVLNKKK